MTVPNSPDCFSVDTERMTANGLTYREYFNWHGTLPPQAVDHLLGLFECGAAPCDQFC